MILRGRENTSPMAVHICMWVRGQLSELALCSQHLSLRDWMQAMRFGSKHLYSSPAPLMELFQNSSGKLCNM